MSKLLVVCIESELTKSDHRYIQSLLKKTYQIDSNIKLQFLSLKGKDNYNKENTIKRIEKELKPSRHDEKHVIYCLDTDNYQEHEIANRNKQIEEFCKQHNYDLVWFCKNIEEVLLGRSVSNSEKLKESQKFLTNIRKFEVIELKFKQNEQPKVKTSNLLYIFDKYLERL